MSFDPFTFEFPADKRKILSNEAENVNVVGLATFPSLVELNCRTCLRADWLSHSQE